MRRSRLLLLVALSGLAVALSVTALPGLDQAEANRTTTTRAQRAQRAKVLRRTLGQILGARDETWRWQTVMSSPRTIYAARADRSVSLRLRRQLLSLWSQRAVAARRSAQHPPHLKQWLCIHNFEGPWNDPNAPYYGGLQMDVTFQQAYGPALLHHKGTADHWTPLEQIWVAERAYQSGRGFNPWPNTARYCGLL